MDPSQRVGTRSSWTLGRKPKVGPILECFEAILWEILCLAEMPCLVVHVFGSL